MFLILQMSLVRVLLLERKLPRINISSALCQDFVNAGIAKACQLRHEGPEVKQQQVPRDSEQRQDDREASRPWAQI